MEQMPHEGEHCVADLQCQNLQTEAGKSITSSSTSVQGPEIGGIKHLEANVLSLTPEKTNEPLHFKCKKEGAELPLKYKLLAEHFDCMTSSLRLLSLCKKAPTFRRICSQVEVLRKRKFSYRHLAQIKFILPEVVQIGKILIHDEKTMCMEPDMKITLLFDVIEGDCEKSTYTALQHIFSLRLFNFISTHPEGCEVPEAELPEPFNKKSIDIASEVLATDSSMVSPTSMIETVLLNSSHLHPLFSRHFSTKDVDVDLEKSQLLASSVPLVSAINDCMTNRDTRSEQQELSDSCSELIMPEKPGQVTCPPCGVSSSAHESTPMKLAFETEKLVVETPALATPKRSVPSENKPKSITSQKWMASNLSAKRSLDFSNSEGEERFLNSGDDAEQHKVTTSFIPGETKVEESTCSTSKATDRDELISHQHMPASLSDLVAIIHHIFQSACFSSITQQELVHKIMVNNLDVVESGEIEDQLELLEKLVPDWISKNVAPSGDLLYNIKKVQDLKLVRENLSYAC